MKYLFHWTHFSLCICSINIVISLCMWCGSWSLLDRAVAYTTSTTPGHIADTADNPEIHGVIAVACLIFLIFMRASISLVAGPLALSSGKWMKGRVFHIEEAVGSGRVLKTIETLFLTVKNKPLEMIQEFLTKLWE